MSALAFRTRISKVTMKGGATVHILKAPSEKRRAYVEADVRNTLDAQGTDIDGWAFVVWGRDYSSTVGFYGGSAIPQAFLPDFVRNRLLAEYVDRTSGYRVTAEPSDDAS